jgi:hypothetical protein
MATSVADKRMERFTFNIVANKATPLRYETLDGRRYCVVPTHMIDKGVHAGSEGPVLYDSIIENKAPGGWDMKPLVIYHPQKNGEPVTAASKEAIETQGIGHIMNTKNENGLDAESWIDVDKSNTLAPEIMEMVEKREPIPVSTGFLPTLNEKPGEYNGKKYNAEVIDWAPDHLAVLIDAEPACATATMVQNKALTNERAVEDVINPICTNMGEMSHSDVRSSIGKAHRAANPNSYGYVEDVFDKYYVFSQYEPDQGDKMYMQKYKVTDQGVHAESISLTGKPAEVKRVTEYRKVGDGSYIGNSSPIVPTKEDSMDRKTEIDALIQNQGSGYTEADREWLVKMPEGALKRIIENSKGPAKAVEQVNNTLLANSGQAVQPPPVTSTLTANGAPTKPLTAREYIATQVPAGPLRTVLTNGLAVLEAEKNQIIERLLKAPVANNAYKFTKEYLEGIGDREDGLDHLRGMAALLPAEPIQNGGGTPMFMGMGAGGGLLDNSAAIQEEALPDEELVFEKPGK